MKEELISFETAVLAKKKGFNIETIYYYDSLNDKCSGKIYNWNLSLQNLKSAPPQSLLQKWLRDKHRLHTMSDQWHNEAESQKWAWSVQSMPLDGKGGVFKCSPIEDEFSFKSYEEAIESGLLEALKLLK